MLWFRYRMGDTKLWQGWWTSWTLQKLQQLQHSIYFSTPLSIFFSCTSQCSITRYSAGCDSDLVWDPSPTNDILEIETYIINDINIINTLGILIEHCIPSPFMTKILILLGLLIMAGPISLAACAAGRHQVFSEGPYQWWDLSPHPLKRSGWFRLAVEPSLDGMYSIVQ